MIFSFRMQILLLLALFHISKMDSAYAFPEMVRHGYVNCTSCHISNSGGGILNDYGRELSKEVLSTWGRDGEQYFAYNLVKPPEWLKLQGEYREGGVYKNTPAYVSARTVFMQADFIAAAQFKKINAVASLGYQEVPKAGSRDNVGSAVSREHYISYSPVEQVSIRGGKFIPNYGIQTPDHVIVSRDLLGLGQGQETYNVEASYLNERMSFFATGIFGRPDDKSQNNDKGAAGRAMLALSDASEAALSVLSSTNDLRKRTVFGPSVIVGFTPHFFWLSEVDFVQTTPKGLSGYSGALNYQKLGYEPIQGLIPYLSQEWYRDNFAHQSSIRESYGLGVQWFPRPHFELNFAWTLRKIYAESSDMQDYSWLLLHVYL